jgi:diphthamide biosynthesis methyltransferase
LDIDLENNRFLEIKDAIKFLIENKAIDEREKIIVASCIGTSNQKIIWKEAKNLIDIEIPLPAVIVVLGKLHFSEREALEKF